MNHIRPSVKISPMTDLDRARAALRDGAPRLDLLTDPELTLGYGEDATGGPAGTPLAVARPREVDEVATLLATCTKEAIKVVPQGGRTGLVGATVPREEEVALSLTRLDRLGEPDLDTLHVEVGAGATLAAVRQHVAAFGLELPIDFAARSACTIGGMVSTNAGGGMAFKYGSMGRQVAGLEFVLADGRVARRMSQVPKDSAGSDLTSILVGAEGTLAVVSAARLRLVPAPPFRLAALLAVDDLDEAIGVVRALRSIPTLEALDFLDRATFELVRDHAGLPNPMAAAPRVLLVAQLAGSADMTADLAAAIEGLGREPEIVIADDTRGREELWAYRELANEALRARGVVRKFDVGVPLRSLPRFLERLRAALGDAHPEAELFVYGHLGDGNLHLNLTGADPTSPALDELVLRRVVGHGGTISAEHGIGVAKRRWLALARSPVEIEILRSLKRAFDPASILSPGRLLPD